FTPILAGEENLVRSQLHVHAMWGEPNLARRPPRSSRGPGPLDPQAFDRPEFVATASRGIKSVPTQHTPERLVGLRHGIADRQWHGAANHDGSRVSRERDADRPPLMRIASRQAKGLASVGVIEMHGHQ